MGKFEHGFGTQLGAVLLWQRVRSGAAWSYQTTAAGNKKTKKYNFPRNSERALGSFCG